MTDDNGGYPEKLEDLPLVKPTTSGDRLIKKDGRESSKHMAIAYMSAGGSSNNAIAKALGLTAPWVCTVLSQTEVKEQIKLIQREIFGDDIEKRFRASLHNSMDVMEGVLGDDKAKDRDRMQAAQWIMEKVTGKATQAIEHKGNVLAGLLDQLDAMRTSQRDVGQEIDLVEETSNADQALDTFVAGNIPDRVLVGDKGEEE